MVEDGKGMGSSTSSEVVEATERSLEILELVKEDGPITLSEIADQLQYSKSTMFRHLNTLERGGYLSKHDDGYRIGLLYLDYGIHAQRCNRLYRAAKPKVDALAEKVGEKVWCMAEENDYAVYIYLKSGEELYKSFTRVGYRGHLHAFPAGKCVLAHLPRQRVEGIIQRRGLPAYTEHTVTTKEELYRELQEIRERGYALHKGEVVVGGNSVAVPVLDTDDAPIGGLSVAGPESRISDEYIHSELADTLLGMKNEVELSLAYDDFSSENTSQA